MVRIFSQYVSARGIWLMVIEAALIATALTTAARLRFWHDAESFTLYTSGPWFDFQVLTVVVTLQICLYYNSLYDFNVIRSQGGQLMRLGQALGAACLLLGFVYYFVPGLLVGRGVLFIAIGITGVGITITRLSLEGIWSLASTPKNVLILGDGELAANVGREFAARRDLNYRLAGFVSFGSNDQQTLFGRPILGSASEIGTLARTHNISRIVVAMENMRGGLPTRDLVRLRTQGIEVEDGSGSPDR